MNPTELINYVKTTYGAMPEYLWPDYPQTFIFRHADNRKWFGVVMDVERTKLGLPGEGSDGIRDCNGRQATTTIKHVSDN